MKRPARNVCLGLLMSVLLAATSTMHAQTASRPWPVRAVVVTTFEVGKDSGDAPGEFQFWVEREHLDTELDFPAGSHALRTNADHTVLGMVSGTTIANAAASLMALGLDPRFDLTHAYFLINGIAGVDPADASIGSAAWSTFVVGDVAREIDAREAPKDWPYGAFPVGSKAPNPDKVIAVSWSRSNLFELNPKLTRWAFELTRSTKLPDDPVVAAFRAGFTGFPNAQKPPFVLLGDTFSSNQFWHGVTLTRYANDWVRLYTEGRGNFVMSAMEDSGFMAVAERLATAGKLDPRRILLLRTASNYTMPRPGHTAVESVNAPFIGTRLALESAYLTGSPVLHYLVDHWDTTAAHIPGD